MQGRAHLRAPALRGRLFLICTAIATALLLIIISFWSQIRLWIDSNEQMAAWVQALGSLITIIVAVALWRYDSYRATKEKESRGRIVAFRVAPVLIDLEKALETADKGLVSAAKVIGTISPADFVDSMRATVLLPAPFDSSIYAEFHCLPPDVAFRLVHTLYSIERHNRQTEKLLDIAIKVPDQTFPLFIQKQKRAIANLREDLNRLWPLFAKEFSLHHPATDAELLDAATAAADATREIQ